MLAIGTVGGGVEAFIRHAACEIRPIRINAVCPGLIDTPMSPLGGDERKAYYEKGSAEHMIPRAGTSAECAAGAMFLLQNDFTTGTIVDVDGGAIIA